MFPIKSLLLFGFFLFVAVVIAAFAYLAWYQACAVTAIAFLFLCGATFRLIRFALGRLEKLAVQLFQIKSQVLRNATADIHSVRAIPSPQANLQPLMNDDNEAPLDEPDLVWYEVEFTIFPDPRQAGQMKHWDLDDLCVVPLSAAARKWPSEEEPADEMTPTSMLLIENGEPLEAEGSKLHGPQRLRMEIGLPKGISDWKFSYYFETFGHIRLPAAFS